MAMMAAVGLALVRLIRPIICSYSLLVRSLRDGYGDGWICGAVPCCSPLAPCPLMFNRFSHLIGVPSRSLVEFSSPHPRSKKTKERKRGGDAGE